MYVQTKKASVPTYVGQSTSREKPRETNMSTDSGAEDCKETCSEV